MSFEPCAVHVITGESDLFVTLSTGTQLVVDLNRYPRLADATAEQLADHRMIGNGESIHWPQLDEDISVRALLIDEPVPAPNPGIAMVNGQPCMPDAQGHFVPVAMIKPQHALEDETVRKIIGHARDLSAQIARFKGHTFEDLSGFDSLLAQQYQVTRGGRKGNRTYMSFDGLLKVQVAMADLVDFGPELQQAKTLIDECLTEWVAEGRDEIRALVTRAFNVEREGQINKAELFMLLRLNFTDARWLRAMDAIRAAIRVVGAKQYFRFYERASTDDGWTAISIDLAKV